MSKIRSISLRLSLNTLLFVALLIVAMLVAVWISTSRLVTTEAIKSTDLQLHSMIKDIEAPLHEVEVTTRDAAQLLWAMRDNKSVVEGILRHVAEETDGVCGCRIAEAQGDSNAWSSPNTDSCNRRVVTYSHAMGEGLALEVDVETEWIEHIVEQMRPYEGSFCSILCRDGSLIGVQDSSLAALIQTRMAEDPDSRRIYSEMLRGGDSMINFTSGGNAAYVVYAPLCTGWSASIMCPYREVMRQSAKLQGILLLTGIIGLAVLFMLCYFVVGRLTKPITRLSEAARQMSHGDFNVPLPEVKSNDEMLQLRDSFAYMQQSLNKYIEELRSTTAANNRMEGELSVARDIQQGMLPSTFPACLHALLVPAKEVGGDLYDFIAKDDKTLYFAIGDVSGKGAPAALLMSITRAALHFVSGLGLSIEEVMTRVNNSIVDTNSGEMFVTLFIGRLDMATGELNYCNAGHNPIIVVGNDGEARYLKAKANIACGVVSDYDYEGERLMLEKGSRLILYTDGVSEAERADKCQFGSERLLQWASCLPGDADCPTLTQSLYNEVTGFTGHIAQNDDITIMTIKY